MMVDLKSMLTEAILGPIKKGPLVDTMCKREDSDGLNC